MSPNNGRNSHERTAISSLTRLMDPDRGTKREREALAAAVIRETVDAAVGLLRDEAHRAERREAAAQEARKHPGRYM